MAVDSLTLSLSSLPSPLYKENTVNLVATAVTKDGVTNTNVTNVEFMLMYSPLSNGPQNNSSLMIPKSIKSDSSASPTGTYSATFNASEFSDPGVYKVQAKGFVISGGVVTVQVFDMSDAFTVVDQNYSDAVYNVLTDMAKEAVNNNSGGIWKQFNLTGAQLKAMVANNAAQASNMLLWTLPATAVLLGGIVKVTGVSALTGSLVKLGDGASANNIVASASLESVANTGVAATFVPILAGSTSLNLNVDAGSGNTVADLEDDVEITVMAAFAGPQVVNM